MPKIGVPKYDSMLRVARDIFWEGECTAHKALKELISGALVMQMQQRNPNISSAT